MIFKKNFATMAIAFMATFNVSASEKEGSRSRADSPVLRGGPGHVNRRNQLEEANSISHALETTSSAQGGKKPFAEEGENGVSAPLRPLSVCGSDDRKQVTSTTTDPWRAIALLEAVFDDGTLLKCTGFFVSRRAVMTAAHCIFTMKRGWAKAVIVTPGENGDTYPYGFEMATRSSIPNGWHDSELVQYDYGAVILSGTTLSDQVGYLNYMNVGDSYLLSSTVNTCGYPLDKGDNKQWHASGSVAMTDASRFGYFIDKKAGSDGGPVWIRLDETRYVVGIHHAETSEMCTGPNYALRINDGIAEFIASLKAEYG